MNKHQGLRLLMLAFILILVIGAAVIMQIEDRSEAFSLPEALVIAEEMYDDFAKKNVTREIENGPCLGTIAPFWAVDIVNVPRKPQDQLLVNRCEGGSYKYLIEISTEGEVLKVR